MVSNLVNCLKELKRKELIESAWFFNGKIKYKLKDDFMVMEI